MSSPAIQQIKERYRLRQDMLRAEVSLTLQISAQRCRIMCGQLTKGDRHTCGRKGRYGVKPGQGQAPNDTHGTVVLPDVDADQATSGSHSKCVRVADDGDHSAPDTQTGCVAVPASDDEGQAYCDIHAGPAFVADAAALALLLARAELTKQRRDYERQLEALVTQLPAWPWVEAIRGFGALGFAQIVGECGDLSDYASPAKVWKRMGLGLVNGERQRRIAGEAAIEHGYSPTRRAVAWNIGHSLMQGNRDGEYRAIYLAEKERQLALYPEVIVMVGGKAKNTARARAANRAERYMTKRLLRNLWRAWRRADGLPCEGVSDEYAA